MTTRKNYTWKDHKNLSKYHFERGNEKLDNYIYGSNKIEIKCYHMLLIVVVWMKLSNEIGW